MNIKTLFYFSLILLLIAGCGSSVSEKDLTHLQGYWEIIQVDFPNGNTKEYGVSTVVDYFELEDKKGFRKKVYPKFDGTFSTSNDAENFVITSKNGLHLHYKNSLTTWNEKIILLNDTELILQNEDDIRYLYRRFYPLNIVP